MIFREQAKGLYLRLRTVNNLVEASIALGVSPAAIKGRGRMWEKNCTMSGNNKRSKISWYFTQENPYLLTWNEANVVAWHSKFFFKSDPYNTNYYYHSFSISSKFLYKLPSILLFFHSMFLIDLDIANVKIVRIRP